MAETTSFQDTRGTALATFAQGGTYSAVADMGGLRLVGLYSDNWPGAAGSLTFRSSWSPSGTGHPVQTVDGTILRVLAFGSGTFYQFWQPTLAMHYLRVEVDAGGTPAAGGGTIVLIGGE